MASHVVQLKTNDHPLNSGEPIWSVSFRLHNGDILVLEMGETTFKGLTAGILETAINHWFESNKPNEIRSSSR